MRRYTYTCMNMTHNVHMSRQQWPVPLPLLVGKYRSQLVSLVSSTFTAAVLQLESMYCILYT